MSSARRESKATRGLSLACLAGGMLVAMAAGGCRASAPATRRAGAEIDPCAERLHDICGQFLLYYSLHGELPGDLRRLKSGNPEGFPPLTCPTSGMPYVYNREGLPVPGRPGRLVLYDAAPSHSRMRWGILAEVAGEGKPLAARVILLPETPVFSANRP